MFDTYTDEEHKMSEIEKIKKTNNWLSNIRCIQCNETPRLIFNENNLTYTIICDKHIKENVPILIVYEDYIQYENFICSGCYKMREEKNQLISMFKCISCQKCYCNICLKRHKIKFPLHKNIIECSKLHNFCQRHYSQYEKYCNICHKKLCKFCIEEKISCSPNHGLNIGPEYYMHNLKEISEIIPTKKSLLANNQTLSDIQEKIKMFKTLINNWKARLEKKIKEFLLSIDKMEILYKTFYDIYQIDNYFEYKSFINYNEIRNIKDKWTFIIEDYNRKFKNNFYDFYNMSSAILNLINNMESLKINYYLNNIKNNQKQNQIYKSEMIQILRKLISRKQNLDLVNDNRIINSLNNILHNKMIDKKDFRLNNLNNYNFQNIFNDNNKFGLNQSYKIEIENKNVFNSLYQNENQMGNQSFMNGIYYKKEQTINTIYDKKSLPKKQHKTLFKVIQYEEFTSNNINNSMDTTNHIRLISNSIVKNNIFNNNINNNIMNNNIMNNNIMNSNIMNNNENRNILYNLIHYEDYSNNNNMNNNNMNKNNLINDSNKISGLLDSGKNEIKVITNKVNENIVKDDKTKIIENNIFNNNKNKLDENNKKEKIENKNDDDKYLIITNINANNSNNCNNSIDNGKTIKNDDIQMKEIKYLEDSNNNKVTQNNNITFNTNKYNNINNNNETNRSNNFDNKNSKTNINTNNNESQVSNNNDLNNSKNNNVRSISIHLKDPNKNNNSSIIPKINLGTPNKINKSINLGNSQNKNNKNINLGINQSNKNNKSNKNNNNNSIIKNNNIGNNQKNSNIKNNNLGNIQNNNNNNSNIKNNNLENNQNNNNNNSNIKYNIIGNNQSNNNNNSNIKYNNIGSHQNNSNIKYNNITSDQNNSNIKNNIIGSNQNINSIKSSNVSNQNINNIKSSNVSNQNINNIKNSNIGSNQNINNIKNNNIGSNQYINNIKNNNIGSNQNINNIKNNNNNIKNNNLGSNQIINNLKNNNIGSNQNNNKNLGNNHNNKNNNLGNNKIINNNKNNNMGSNQNNNKNNNKGSNQNYNSNDKKEEKKSINRYLDTDNFSRLEDYERLFDMNMGEKIINCICYLDNWRLIFGINDISKGKRQIVLYEFSNEKKNLISRLIIENEFKEKINCIIKLSDETSNNHNISKNIAICGKDCFIKIININLFQDKYKLCQKIYTGEKNYIYNMIELKNKYLISCQLKNILLYKKTNSFSNYKVANIYNKIYLIETNTPTIKVIPSGSEGEFITLQSKIQKVTFYIKIKYDISLEEKLVNNSNNKQEEDNENIILSDDDEDEDCVVSSGEIKFASNVLNIYLLSKDIMGCNDEESVFLINVQKKAIVAQILLGLKIFCSKVTSDLSLIFSALNKKNENGENKGEIELIQYKLNNEKDNMVRLRNAKKNIYGVDTFFCLENDCIIFYNIQKNNIIIMKSKKSN